MEVFLAGICPVHRVPGGFNDAICWWIAALKRLESYQHTLIQRVQRVEDRKCGWETWRGGMYVVSALPLLLD